MDKFMRNFKIKLSNFLIWNKLGLEIKITRR